jgi:hypothetical protein
LKLTLTTRRIIAAALLPIFVVALVNMVLKLHLFGEHDLPVLGAIALVGVIWHQFFAPSADELRESRESRRQEHGERDE